MKSFPSSTTLDDACPCEPDNRHARSETESLIARMRAATDWPEVLRLRNDAWVANLDLVHAAVRRLPRRVQSEDLISVGTCALLEAVGSFDHQRGVPFAVHATTQIKFRVLDHLAAHQEPGWVLGAHAGRKLFRLRRALWRDGRDPDRISNRELATAAGVSIGVVRRLRPLLRPCASLHQPISGPDGASCELIDIARVNERWAECETTPSDTASMADDQAELHRALQRLDWRSRFVLERAFGLDGKGPRRHADLAAPLGVTRQRAQQIGAQALATLRATWRS